VCKDEEEILVGQYATMGNQKAHSFLVWCRVWEFKYVNRSQQRGVIMGGLRKFQPHVEGWGGQLDPAADRRPNGAIE
jgi:hypothetical protein